MERGKPPYRVSNRPELPKSHPNYSGNEQFSKAENLVKAVEIIVDLTDFGDVHRRAYIVDSENKKILDLSRPEDVCYIKSLDNGQSISHQIH